MFQNHAKGSSEGARLLAVIIERLLFVLWQPVLFRKSLHSEFQISSHSTHSTHSALSAPVFASQALDIFSKVVANCSAVIGIWRPEFSPPTGLDNHRKTTRKTQEDYDYDDGDSVMTMTFQKKKGICHPVVLVRLVLLGCSPCLQRHTNLGVEPKATGSSRYLQRLHDKGTEQVTEAKPAIRETMQTARHDTNDMWLMWLMWPNMCHTEMKSLWTSRCQDAAGESHTGFPFGRRS